MSVPSMQESDLMDHRKALALVVARPGPLRDGIEALLASVPQLEVVATAAVSSWALRLAARHAPDLLVIDAGLPGDEIERLMAACRRGDQGPRCIALADNDEQELAANAAGADAVILKGFPADRFAETVEQLLSGGERLAGSGPLA